MSFRYDVAIRWPRPWGTVWGLRDKEGRPWRRPLNDKEMVELGYDLNNFEPFPEGAGRWEWP